ncbi:hypothetical protein MRX96_024782 [Rhipicephalus microplus]
MLRQPLRISSWRGAVARAASQPLRGVAIESTLSHSTDCRERSRGRASAFPPGECLRRRLTRATQYLHPAPREEPNASTW